MKKFLPTTIAALTAFTPATQAVNWNEAEGSPWKLTTNQGPDAEVSGFFINLGITGARAKLTEKHPEYLVIQHVFKNTPAHGKLQVGDLIVGANGKAFTKPHINGYGPGKFGGEGPLIAFGNALAESQVAGGKWNGKLSLDIKRDSEKITTSLDIGTKYGDFSETYPSQCDKTDLILKELLKYIASRQNNNGSFPGGSHVGIFSGLALLAIRVN